MSALTSVRHLAILELAGLVAGQLPGWSVHATWPGDELEMNAVYIGGAQGPVSVQSYRVRRRRGDRFTVTAIVQGGSPQSVVADAMTQAAIGLAAIEDVLAENPTLGVTGLEALGDEVAVDGPNTFPARNGVFTTYTLDISGIANYE